MSFEKDVAAFTEAAATRIEALEASFKEIMAGIASLHADVAFVKDHIEVVQTGVVNDYRALARRVTTVESRVLGNGRHYDDEATPKPQASR
jgi:hypothetical protein